MRPPILFPIKVVEQRLSVWSWGNYAASDLRPDAWWQGEGGVQMTDKEGRRAGRERLDSVTVQAWGVNTGGSLLSGGLP